MSIVHHFELTRLDGILGMLRPGRGLVNTLDHDPLESSALLSFGLHPMPIWIPTGSGSSPPAIIGEILPEGTALLFTERYRGRYEDPTGQRISCTWFKFLDPDGHLGLLRLRCGDLGRAFTLLRSSAGHAHGGPRTGMAACCDIIQHGGSL